MRALVTGAAGFVGHWVVRELLERGAHVTGASLTGAPEGPGAPGADLAIDWMRCDVRDRADVARTLDAARPDAIIHLAGIAAAPVAAREPETALATNVGSTLLLLDAVRERREKGTLDPLCLVIGSGEEYGRHDDGELPLKETAELRPHSVYAATKVAQEVLALQAHRTSGVRVVCTRAFNHTGRGQAPAFLLPALVSRALALRGVAEPKLVMGNQHPVRDFLHVADVARAYVLLAERGAAGEVYNVASGVGHSVGELARRVVKRVGIEAEFVSDPALQRPADVPALTGDSAKLRALGWSPKYDLDAIIDDLINAASH